MKFIGRNTDGWKETKTQYGTGKRKVLKTNSTQEGKEFRSGEAMGESLRKNIDLFSGTHLE